MNAPPVPLDVEQSAPQPHVGRVWLLRAVTLALFAVLVARLWFLQVVHGAEYERLAARNLVRLEPTAAPRGAIVDREGRLLATNRLGHRIAILDVAGGQHQHQRRRLLAVNAAAPDEAERVGLPNPSLDEQLALLTRLLELDTDELAELHANLNDPQRPKFTPVTVREDADNAALTRVQERLWQLPSVVIEDVPMRTYPRGRLCAHVVGYVGQISPTALEKRRAAEQRDLRALTARGDRARRTLTNAQLPQLEELNQRLRVLERLSRQTARVVGQTGLEEASDAELTGEPGMQTWQVNARNAPVRLVSTTVGEAGHELVLNLDARLQQAAANALAGRAGSVSVLDPRDGAVLALYSSPTYDPNHFVPRIDRARWRALLHADDHPLENRCLRAAYPPGSTFKGLIGTAAGLSSGAIGAQTTSTCEGGLTIGGHFKKCWATHGTVGLTAAVAHSCDVFFYQAALRMGPQPIIAMARAFGLGDRTGIDLPGERPGALPDPARHKRRWKREWYGGDTANIVIGQGDVGATTLQMARATAAVANGGTLWRPQVVREVRQSDARTVLRPWTPAAVGTVPLSAAQLGVIREAMRAAVDQGTAHVVALPGIAVCAKTGSAEDGTQRLPHAWFVCFAPADHPRIALCAMVENAGHGAEAAGPIARAVLAEYFREQGMLP